MIRHPKRNGRYHHFKRRVRESIGAHVDADALWRILIEEINARDQTAYLKFICRINREGLRLWRIEIEGRRYAVLFDHAMDCPVTVFPQRGTVPRIGKPPLRLEEIV